MMDVIRPDWPAPKSIRALCTTRLGGVSLPPYDSFNLATHVGDAPSLVRQNRQRLNDMAQLPDAPMWLEQMHTDRLVCLNGQDSSTWVAPKADAAWSDEARKVAVVMTADCLPLLVTNRAGSLVCAIHAGWKGLANGIVRKSLLALPENPENLLVWIGPSIRQPHFEVGQDVFEVFAKDSPQSEPYFQIQTVGSVPSKNKYLADLAGLLILELKTLGVEQIYDSELCSYEDSSRFYSYRRDGQTGRMASLIWLDPSDSAN
ncbi:peptidoglycan editing factor PgeF [Thiomicrorhabdus chilensis]|uniref:peptidoglycan editing factor PgeF n=1 Tax=Thiomicrorhabdus chilensis TaxID=63656 RepID=UPI00048A5894|nr:peptidoglycan editing factor PgeF [Thiomicrorhabdus chilensis]